MRTFGRCWHVGHGDKGCDKAKIAGKPLFRMLAEAKGARQPARLRLARLAAIIIPASDDNAPARRCAAISDRGYIVVKMKIGGATIGEVISDDRGCADRNRRSGAASVDANGRFDLETASPM